MRTPSSANGPALLLAHCASPASTLTRPCPDDQLCQLQLNCIVLGLLFAIDTDKHPEWMDAGAGCGMKWYSAQQDPSSPSMRHITIDPLIQFLFKLFSSSLNTATDTSIRRRTASNTRRADGWLTDWLLHLSGRWMDDTYHPRRRPCDPIPLRSTRN